MPRIPCQRTAQNRPGVTYYKPAGVPLRQLSEVRLQLDEYEAIRLADLEGLYHGAAARLMNISRQTFGRIIASGRKKIANALVNGQAIRIEPKNPYVRVPISNVQHSTNEKNSDTNGQEHS